MTPRPRTIPNGNAENSTEPFVRPSIGIVGSGPIGRGIHRLLTRAGYRAVFSSRQELRSPAGADVGPAGLSSFADASQFDVIILSIRHDASNAVVEQYEENLRGKIVIDTMNSFVVDDAMRIQTGVVGQTEGRRLQSLLPDSFVVRAFTHVQHELLVSRAETQPGLWAMAVSGDDQKSVHFTMDLVRDCGYLPVDIGPLDRSGPLDPGGALFPNMWLPGDMLDRVDAAAHRGNTDAPLGTKE